MASGSAAARRLEGILRVIAWASALLVMIFLGIRVMPTESIRTSQDRIQAAQHDLEEPGGVAGAGQNAGHQKQGLTYLRLMIKHLPVMAVIAAVLLMVGGVLGSGLGLPGLFRDPPDRDQTDETIRRMRKGYAYSRGGHTAFWGAFGATILIAIVWSSIFYEELVEHIQLFDPSHFNSDSRASFELLPKDFRNHGDLLRFLSMTAAPFLGLLLLAEWFHAPAPGMDRVGKERRTEFLHAVGGTLLGVIVVFALARLGGFTHGYSRMLWEWASPWLRDVRLDIPSLGIHDHFSLFAIDELGGRKLEPAIKITFLTSLGQFIAFVVVAYAAFLVGFRRNLSPGLGICLLLGVGVIVVTFLSGLSTLGQAGVVLLLLALIMYTNGRPYKYRFPGMANYYDERLQIDDLERIFPPDPDLNQSDVRVLAWGDGSTVPESGKSLIVAGADVQGRLHLRVFDAEGAVTTDTDETRLAPALAGEVAAFKKALPGWVSAGSLSDEVKNEIRADVTSLLSPNNPALFGLLRNVHVLEKWREHTKQEKPRLVLVATTGGAYRASFWTTVVLEELGRFVGEDLYRHIRLLTGASGGMVGAGYFAASMTREGPPAGKWTVLLRDESGLDSLTPVVRRLLTGDLPATFLPRQKSDRGIELERQWVTMGKTFAELSEGEREGWRPSLIVSPMVVESGRRLLFSNLDLSRLAETRPLDPPGAGARAGNAAAAARLYSRSAVEFFRIFPRARPHFVLQTAVRMNATFPLASPTVSLPIEPTRRVVDAGYYDNYGVDLATSWIYEHQDWIKNNTSGVALIQIRAYPSEKDVLSRFGTAGGKPGFWEWLGTCLVCAFQGVTSPLAGGLSAREWSMRFRNATQVRIVDDAFNGRGGETANNDFFETFVFENFTDFAMNWFLSDDDIDGMRRSIGAPVVERTGPGGRRIDNPDAQGQRSNSDQALMAREVVKGQNLKQKERFKAWFQAGHAAPPQGP